MLSGGAVIALKRGSIPSAAHHAAWSWCSTSVFRSTRLLHQRSRSIKPNPFETKGGRFDTSFEKLTAGIEEVLPLSDRHLKRGTVHDRLFGEEAQNDTKRLAEGQMVGREEETPAARQARSYFSDEDLSPEALHVRSPRLKVAQRAARPTYDKKILKVSKEADQYYYTEPSPESIKKRQRLTFVACVSFGAVTFCAWEALSAYMLSG